MSRLLSVGVLLTALMTAAAIGSYSPRPAQYTVEEQLRLQNCTAMAAIDQACF